MMVFASAAAGSSPRGAAAVGERLTNRLEPPGGRGMTVKPTVTESTEGRVFEWLGRAGIPGIFDGRHRFQLTDVDGRTRLEHSEAFFGIFVPFMRKSLDTHTLKGFEAMNAALKERAEARVRTTS